MKFKILGVIICFTAFFLGINYWSQVSFDIVQKEHRSLLQQITIKQAIQLEENLKKITASHQWVSYQLNTSGQLEPQELEPLLSHLIKQTRELTRISISPNSVVALTQPRQSDLIGSLILPPTSRVHNNAIQAPFYEAPVVNINNQILLTKHEPVLLGGRHWGYISYTLNLSLIFNQSHFRELIANQYNYQLVHLNKHNKENILMQSISPLGKHVYQARINLPNAGLLLKMSPGAKSYTSNIIMNLVFSLSIASIFTLVCYLGLTEPARLRRRLIKSVKQHTDLKLILNSIVDNVNDEIIFSDINGKILINNKIARINAHTPPNILFSESQTTNPKTLFEYDGKTPIGPAEHPINRTLYNDEYVNKQVMLIGEDLSPHRLEITSFAIRNDQQRMIGALCIGKTLNQTPQSLIGDLSRAAILEMLEKNKSLKEVFDYTISKTQHITKDVIVSISLTNQQQISEVYSNDLPMFYRHSIIGSVIDNRIMSSNSAISQNKMVIVEDITVHPYWIDNKELANQANFRSCWSQPVHNLAGEAIGSLDFYSPNIMIADPSTIVILKETALLVALTLERHKDIYRLNKMSLAVQHSTSAVTIVDAQGFVEYINPKYSQVSGYHPMDIVGNTSPLFSKENAQYKDIHQAMKNKQTWSGEVRMPSKSGSPYWSTATLTPIFDQDKTISQIVISEEHISAIAPDKLDAQHYQKSIDALTGLYTQYAFVQRLDRLLCQPHSNINIHCLANLNIDQYQEIGQTLGVNASDELLRQVGQLLNQAVRRRDTVARLSADQFVILMEDCHWEPALKSLHQLVEHTKSYQFQWQNRVVPITLSIGLTEIENGRSSSEIYLQQADIACLKAKDCNENIIVFEQQERSNMSLKGDLYWSQKIRHALSQDNFSLYVQQATTLPHNPLRRQFDILVRLPSDGGFVLPENFVAAASRYHLSIDIDKWVIEHTIDYLTNNSNLQSSNFSISLSEASLLDLSFPLYLLALWESQPNAFNALSFEFSEYHYTCHTALCQQLIDAMKQTQCHFVMNSFGQGFSSFSLLRNAKVNGIKINGDLLKALTADPLSEQLVGSIVTYANALELDVIAGHIESDNVNRKLNELGFTQPQGVGLTRAIALSELDNQTKE